jgi:phosphate transport system regulatory protein PhoU
VALKKHTDQQYDAELEGLRSKLLTLGGKVESEIAVSMRALAERDSKLAEQVVESDREVNLLELEVDESCRRLLALRQPAASDLRFITTALKIVVDLERVGDLAVNIAERAIDLNQSPPLPPVHDISRLAQLCQSQLRKALDALVDADAEKAAGIIGDDDLLDALYHTRAPVADDGGSAQHPARKQPALRRQAPRAPRRSCHQRRRDGGVHGARHRRAASVTRRRRRRRARAP